MPKPLAAGTVRESPRGEGAVMTVLVADELQSHGC